MPKANQERRRAGAGAVLCAAVAIAPTGAHALDLSWQPQLRVGMRATDNVLWAAENQEAAVGFDNGGGVIVKAETRDWRSLVTPSFNFRRFAIGENLDADEYGVRSQHQWLATSQLQLGANLDFVRESTNSTELTDAGFRNQIANRSTLTVQPNVTYFLSEDTSLNGSYVYQDVSFDTTANGQLVNFSFEQISLGATHVVTEKLRLTALGFASEFETPDAGGRTRTYGGQGGASYQFTEDFGVDGTVGYVKSDIEFETSFLALDPGPPPRLVLVAQQQEVSTTGPIASATVRKNFENLRTRLDYVRRVTPSIRGSQQLEDDIALSAERDVSSFWRLGFRGGYNMRSAEAQDVEGVPNQLRAGDLNRDQASVGGWISYRLTNQLAARAEYRFSRNAFVLQSQGPVYNSSLFLTLSYDGTPRFWRGL